MDALTELYKKGLEKDLKEFAKWWNNDLSTPEYKIQSWHIKKFIAKKCKMKLRPMYVSIDTAVKEDEGNGGIIDFIKNK